MTIALLILNAVLLALLVWLLWQRGSSSDRLIQQQLIELPRVLAENRVEQSTTLSNHFAELSHSLTSQLESTHSTVNQRLGDAGAAVADVRERLGELAKATDRLETLGEQVADVQDLLRVPQLRGTLGEVWLEELLSQIFPDAMYRTQYTFPTGDRVDAVLKLGGRLVPVDSKFPLESCQRLLKVNGTDYEREKRTFTRAVKTHVDSVADKYILPSRGTYDFAMMYVPSERVYYEAVVRDEDSAEGQSIIAYAMARKVIPVSPNTFYAYLVAVLHGLRGLQVGERAREILGSLASAQAEFTRLRKANDVAGRHLENAVRQYADAARMVERLERRVAEVVSLPGD